MNPLHAWRRRVADRITQRRAKPFDRITKRSAFTPAKGFRLLIGSRGSRPAPVTRCAGAVHYFRSELFKSPPLSEGVRFRSTVELLKQREVFSRGTS